MESSSFSKLAPELRNRIFEMALSYPDPTSIDESCKRRCKDALRARNPRALTMTCRKINLDTRSMFFAVNRFSFSTPGYHTPSSVSPQLLANLRVWLRLIGPANAELLRQFHVMGVCCKVKSIVGFDLLVEALEKVGLRRQILIIEIRVVLDFMKDRSAPYAISLRSKKAAMKGLAKGSKAKQWLNRWVYMPTHVALCEEVCRVMGIAEYSEGDYDTIDEAGGKE